MILVNNPGNWGALYPPVAHAPWHGCTPTDLVFPFFLFAASQALALVMPGLRASGRPGASGRLGAFL
jgi:predicted acyltransferase